jgi:hypothetical protein
MALAAGVVDLNRDGEAVVALPKRFTDLHIKLRYQLTPIGGPAPNLHVAQEIRGGKFKIAGGTSKLKVSWQIAGELKERRVAHVAYLVVTAAGDLWKTRGVDIARRGNACSTRGSDGEQCPPSESPGAVTTRYAT